MEQSCRDFIGRRSLRKLIPCCIPLFFGLVGFYCLLFVDSGLTTDGYFHLISAEVLQNTLSYTGVASIGWPPLYTITIALAGTIVNLELAAKIISLLSGIGILIAIPLFLRWLGYGWIPGLFVQVLVGLSPKFLSISLIADNHVFGAFLFLSAAFFGIKYFQSDKPRFPWGFLLFSILACLTRYPSWVLPFGFLITGLLYPGKKGGHRKHAFIVFCIVLTLTAPWFVYNYTVNGNLASEFKGLGALGVGFEETGTRDWTQLEWLTSEMFQYSHSLELLKQFPEEYGHHVLTNIGNAIKLITYQFPPLDLFSCLILLGLLVSIPKLSSPEWLFPVLLMVSFMTIMIFTRFVWEYIIHLGILWASLGAVLLHDLLEERKLRIPGKELRASTVILGLFLTGLFMKVPGDYLEFQRLVYNEFHRNWTASAYVRKKLHILDEKTTPPAERIKIMSSYYYFSDIYSSGYRTVQAPLPKTSAMDLFCYSELSPRAFDFFAKLNYPSNLTANEYVPPDYVLITPVFGTLLVENTGLEMDQLNHYLEPIPWWRGKPVELYKVRKDRINCSGRTIKNERNFSRSPS